MPIYEYVCPACEKVEEVLQNHNDPAPLCEKDNQQMKKIMSLPFFRFRGAGFYSIDYGTPKMGQGEDE